VVFELYSLDGRRISTEKSGFDIWQGTAKLFFIIYQFSFLFAKKTKILTGPRQMTEAKEDKRKS
jgi:hypothetical protein